jgi:hypothetical protein
MMLQTRTLAIAMTLTIPAKEGETTTEQLEWAKSLGEGILMNKEAKENDDLTPEGHKYNSYEKIMSVFGGQGNVQMNQYG